jgi:hypothetical protein
MMAPASSNASGSDIVLLRDDSTCSTSSHRVAGSSVAITPLRG